MLLERAALELNGHKCGAQDLSRAKAAGRILAEELMLTAHGPPGERGGREEQGEKQ